MSKKTSPSMDSWLKEAKAHESAPKIGMYLTHNGIVRESAKAKVRQGAADIRPVVGMQFSTIRKLWMPSSQKPISWTAFPTSRSG